MRTAARCAGIAKSENRLLIFLFLARKKKHGGAVKKLRGPEVFPPPGIACPIASNQARSRKVTSSAQLTPLLLAGTVSLIWKRGK